MQDNLFDQKKFVRVTEYTSPFYDFKDIYEEQAVLEHIYKRLQILRGTYVFDPEYGTDILRYIFEFMGNDLEDKIKEEVATVIREIPAVDSFDIMMNRREQFKEVTLYIIINFRSGNSYTLEINSNNLTTL